MGKTDLPGWGERLKEGLAVLGSFTVTTTLLSRGNERPWRAVRTGCDKYSSVKIG
jgi:hypothetical protein